ncbi:HEAT repeat domain-containing protein, partial [Chamaesiphon polymorphus]
DVYKRQVLSEALDRILNWLHDRQRQHPEFSGYYWGEYGGYNRIDDRLYPQMRLGLSRLEIAEISKELPEPLPPEVIELYQWRNGSISDDPRIYNWLFNFREGFGSQRAAKSLDLQSAVSSYRNKQSYSLEDVTVDNLLTTRYDNNSMQLFEAAECVDGYMVMNQSRQSYPIVFWDFKGGSDVTYTKYASLTDMMVTIAESYENACTIDKRGRIIENKDKWWEIWRKYNASYWVNLSLRNIDLIQNKLPSYICGEYLSVTVVKELADTLKFSQDVRLIEVLSSFLRSPRIDPDFDRQLKHTASMYLSSVGGSQAVDYLLPILNDDDWETRYLAIVALGQIKDDRSVPALINCLQDEQEHVRRQAQVALDRIQTGDGKLAGFRSTPAVSFLESQYGLQGLDLYDVTGLSVPPIDNEQ